MSLIMNKLESQQDIEEFKQWLETKSLRKLNIYLNNYKRDLKKDYQQFVNHELRIELVSNEINKRINSEV